jgi:L-alanine-DL-glutamate epimerase-like enolase superfamily enzyme
MHPTRRDWLKLTGSAALAALVRRHLQAAGAEEQPYLREYEKPMFDLPGRIREAVKITSVEMLKRGSSYFVRTQAANGATGLIMTKQVEDFIPIFQHLVAPQFIGQDAREIETLVNTAYRANYKLAGLALWCPIAYVEQSILDLLGRVARQPVGALLGGVMRPEIPVYLSGSARELSAEEEVAVYVRGVAETQARAVKFKIGGRMSRNLDAYPGRTDTLIRLAREKLGPAMILYADANGSYNVPKAIAVGRQLEALNYQFFEEPCPFEELSETQEVARALKIPVAFGEQNYSLWQFQWMLQNGVMQIVQPDINYNGGLIRAKRVARMAEKLGRTIVPHNTQTGATAVNILQFASSTKNIGAFMEFPWRAPQAAASWFTPNFKIENGVVRVPTTPGMGIGCDLDYLKTATVVARIDRPARAGGSGSG